MIFKLAGAVLLCLFLSNAQADAMCSGVFIKNRATLAGFDRLTVEIRGNEAGVIGRKANAWVLLGSLRYVVRNGLLTFTYALDKPEYHGFNFFSDIITAIVLKNPSVKRIAVSITGPYYIQFRTDLGASQNVAAAIEANAVYKQLTRAGFSKVTFSDEFHTGLQPFVRLVTTRP